MQKLQSFANVGRRLVTSTTTATTNSTAATAVPSLSTWCCSHYHYQTRHFRLGRNQTNTDDSNNTGGKQKKFEFDSFTETPKSAEREFYRQRYEERLTNECNPDTQDGIDLEGDEHTKAKKESDLSMFVVNKIIHPTNNNTTMNENNHSSSVDGNNKTNMTDIVKHFELEYSRLDHKRSANIASRASVVPGMNHLFVLQLRHPHNSQCKIHLLGVRQESAGDTDKVFKEIHTLLGAVKPCTLIVQTCEERFEKFIERMEASKQGGIFLTDTLKIEWSQLLNPSHIAYTARYALSLIHMLARDESHHSRLSDGDLLTKHNRIDVFSLTANFANERMESTNKIILGDVPVTCLTQQTDGNIFDNTLSYMGRTTMKQRKNLGSYPGIREILLGFNSVNGVNEWIANNKNYIRSKERQVHQFAQDMQVRMKYGQGMIDRSARSLSYFAFREGLPTQNTSEQTLNVDDDHTSNSTDKENSNNNESKSDDTTSSTNDDVSSSEQIKNIVVLCNVTTMLSIPLHFGQVSLAEVIAMRKQQTNQERRLSLIKRWTLNYWNGFCWTVCGMHVLVRFILSQPIDEEHLMMFGLLFPLGYPTLFALLSLRARLRTRRLLRLYQENKKKKSILAGVNSKLTVS